jgi:phosphoserine phosphatase RsbU/P
MPGTASDRRRLPAAATPVAGALLFALGLALGRARLPEWRLGALPDQHALGQKLQAIVARCGLRLAGGGSLFELCEISRRKRAREQVPLTSAVPSAEVAIRICQPTLAVPPDLDRRSRTLKVWFDPGGRPRAIDRRPSGAQGVLRALHETAPVEGRRERFAAALLEPGERLGKPVRLFLAGFPVYIHAIAGTSPPEHVTAVDLSVITEASRNAGTLESAVSGWADVDLSAGSGDFLALQGALFVMVVAFGVLAIRRRVSLANACSLGVLAFLAVLPGALLQRGAQDMATAGALLAAASAGLAVLWSAAESLWRAADPRFDTSLDVLRSRRLTRRAGEALLRGLGLGAAAAGLGLAASALATYLPGTRAHALSVDLPVLDGTEGPLAYGVVCAAVVAFLLACGRRFGRRRWLPVAVALAAALVLAPIKLQPWPVGLASNALVAGALVAAGELGGMAGLLAASLGYRLLPAAAFSAMHLAWLPGSFALSAGVVAILLVAGTAGALRAPAAEREEVRPPAFIVRMERERRLAVEMELLARMQLGLLPAAPLVPGWEIAARSAIAGRAGGDLYDFLRDRAGRWWIAAGDVAGHGHSCAIAQAMVKAALASLLADGRTPSEVLAETDRVLRSAALGRSFTSLALLRLDPATGEALFANAGHPFPLLAGPGMPAHEIELPGLPLGQGPPRRYADLPLALPRGATLVLCSDGLFEAVAGGREGGAPYGFERPGAVLDGLAGRPAGEVLDGLLADWHRHLGAGTQADDVTLVVLRRSPS